MKNTLTSVPIAIPTTSVNDSGNCMSEPMSPRCKNGRIANMVVSEVMMMGFSLLCPANMVARNKEYLERRNLLIVSTFNMESLMMMPLFPSWKYFLEILLLV